MKSPSFTAFLPLPPSQFTRLPLATELEKVEGWFVSQDPAQEQHRPRLEKNARSTRTSLTRTSSPDGSR